MKTYIKYFIISILIAIIIFSANCKIQNPSQRNQDIDIITTNIDGKGMELEFELIRGKHHNHPSMVFWMEDMNENYVQTFYITKYVGTGIYGHGDAGNGEWQRHEGTARRPATLPYWAHKRKVIAEDSLFVPTPKNPIPDAYTGATPKSSYILKTTTDKPIFGKIKILFEVNQAWDWNNFWHTNKFPDNKNYNTSCQPSIIYAVTINLNSNIEEYYLNPIGHGSYDGSNGILYTDLKGITTALDIFKSIKVTIRN